MSRRTGVCRPTSSGPLGLRAPPAELAYGTGGAVLYRTDRLERLDYRVRLLALGRVRDDVALVVRLAAFDFLGARGPSFLDL
jgi:hypothetical protein